MRVSFSVAAGIALTIARTVNAQPQYEITDLGGAGALGTTHANGVNSQAQVAGESSPLLGGSTPFLWENGEMLDLGTLEGSSSAQAHAINDSRQVVGESSSNAFLWEDGEMIDLGSLPGGNFAIALDINNAGQVTGYSDDIVDGDPPLHSFIWQDGLMMDLGEPEGFEYNLAYAMNDLGQTVGRIYFVNSADHHAFLYSNGIWTDLGTLGDDALSHGQDIRAYPRTL